MADDFLDACNTLMKQQMLNSFLQAGLGYQSTMVDYARSHRRIEDISNTAFATSLHKILSIGQVSTIRVEGTDPLSAVSSTPASLRDTSSDVTTNTNYTYMPLAVC